MLLFFKLRNDAQIAGVDLNGRDKGEIYGYAPIRLGRLKNYLWFTLCKNHMLWSLELINTNEPNEFRGVVVKVKLWL